MDPPWPLHFKAHLGGSVTVAVKHLHSFFDSTSHLPSLKKKRGPGFFQFIKLSMKKIHHFQFPSFSLRFRLSKPQAPPLDTPGRIGAVQSAAHHTCRPWHLFGFPSNGPKTAGKKR